MLTWSLSVVFGVVMGGVLLWVFAAALRAYLYVAPRWDETHFFPAEDGLRLAMHRYRPSVPCGAAPVVMCHGLSANSRIFDLKGAPSPALYLRDKGFDVWTLDLRGAGESAKPGVLTSDCPRDWGFEDHLRNDIPAALRYVTKATGADAAHYIGHSMGGMLGVAHTASGREPQPLSLTCIGSPVNFSRVYGRRYHMLLRFQGLLKVMPLSPLTAVLRLTSPLMPSVTNRFAWLFHLPNVDTRVARLVPALASETMAGASLWLDFARFIGSGVFGPEEGGAYTDGLEKARIPILLIHGSRDVLAPRVSLTPAGFSTATYPLMTLVQCGRSAGHACDYGHVDLVVGRRADLEVFPLIASRLGEIEAAQRAAL
jgi:polyhydroxyalkanoate synthase